MNPVLAIDETSLAAVSSSDADEAIDALLDLVDICLSRDEEVTAGRDLYDALTSDGVTFEALAWGPDGVSPEVRERLSVFLGRLNHWDDTHDWQEMEVEVADETLLSPTIAWVHGRFIAGDDTACLTWGGAHRGVHDVSVGGRHADLWFVGDERELIAFFRALLEVRETDDRTYPLYAPHAFPGLRFADGAWRGLRDFSAPFKSLRAKVSAHLAVLSDDGAWCFTAPGPAHLVSDFRLDDCGPISEKLIADRFATRGVNISTEAAEVRKDEMCRRSRTATVGGQDYYCEWHTKFERHKDRIHIHPPAGGDPRVIVGVFHRHLRLPGDP